VVVEGIGHQAEGGSSADDREALFHAPSS
jgi:hypothetical protein